MVVSIRMVDQWMVDQWMVHGGVGISGWWSVDGDLGVVTSGW